MDQLLAQLPALLLIASRVGGLTAASPVFTNKFLQPTLRVFFAFLLAIAMVPVVKVAPGATDGTALLPSCVLELLVGLTMGFLSRLVFAVAQMAGAWLDLDMGFTMAQIFDPVNGNMDPIMGVFFENVALMVYFGLNAHQWLIRALADSFDVIPAGGLVFKAEGPMHIVTLFGPLLGAALQMVLPFIAVMLLTTMALAGLSRAVPQLNIFAVGMGLKALMGLIILTVMLPFFLSFLQVIFKNGNTEMLKTLQLMR